MPRLPTDYSNTIIYKIVCKNLEITDCYVGNTTDFRKRKYKHKFHSKIDNYNYKIYKIIRENGGWDNWDMIEIEKFSCKDANEAKARERYWYEELKANLNSIRPILTIEEKKEYKKNQDKKRYENILSKKIYCECGGKYEEGNKNRHFKTDKHKNYLANIIVGV